MGSLATRKVTVSAWLVALGWTFATAATCIGVVAGRLHSTTALVLYTLGLSMALCGQAWLERDRLRDAIDLRRRLNQRRRRKCQERQQALARVTAPSIESLPVVEYGAADITIGDARVRDAGSVGGLHPVVMTRWCEALEGAGGAAWEWELPSGVVNVASSWTCGLGYEPTQLEPRIEAWTRLIHPEDHARLLAAIERHLRELTEEFRLEMRVMDRGGLWRRYELRARVVQRDLGGEALRISGLLFAMSEESMTWDGAESSSEEGLCEQLSIAVSERPGSGHDVLPEGLETGASSMSDLISLDGVRVLVAEDGPDNQRVLRWQLERLGCQVSMVDEGQSAVAQLVAAPQDFDVLLLDMQMPVMDGYTTARRLRDVGFELPIIALTSYLSDSEKQRCRESGCDASLEKPVHRERLRVCLLTLLQRAGVRVVDTANSTR